MRGDGAFAKRATKNEADAMAGWERGSPEPLMECGKSKKSGSGEPRSQPFDTGVTRFQGEIFL